MGEIVHIPIDPQFQEAVDKCRTSQAQAITLRARERIPAIGRDVERLTKRFGVTPAHLDGIVPMERIPAEEQTTPQSQPPAPYVAAKFRTETFDTYQPHPEHPSQWLALEAAREFCRSVHRGTPQLLALIGPPGTGKSHLLYAAAKALHLAGHRVFTRPWYLLADHLRYGGPGPWAPVILEPGPLRRALQAEDIVMIDEVRPTAGTDFDDTELAKIVLHAYDNDQAVFITTNVSPLMAVVGPAIASRFTKITVTGPDWRQA